MAASAVLAAAAGGLAPAPAAAEQDHAVVLMYHRVGEGEHPSTNVTEEQFRDHLEHLESEGYRVLPLEEIVRRVAAGDPLPDGAVALTFDDAYASVGDIAHELLAERDWPYTVFVSSGYIDGDYRGYLDWERMEEMAAEGARFGNHSEDHDHLFAPREGESRGEWRRRVREDLEGAQERLEEQLGEAVHQDPPLLAYPYGEYGAELTELVEELGYTAFGQQSGVIGPHSHPRALPRFPMNETYAEADGFRTKVAARPLPVVESDPWDPVREDAEPPVLEIRLGELDADPQGLRCYYGEETLEPDWREDGRRFRVQGEAELPAGRSRYNCTLQGEDGLYWHSQLWIRGTVD